jgi:hypothetical protein
LDRATVSALLNEIEFFFEQFENIAIVTSHFSNLQFSLAQSMAAALPLPSITAVIHAVGKCNAHAESHFSEKFASRQKEWENLLRFLRKSAQGRLGSGLRFCDTKSNQEPGPRSLRIANRRPGPTWTRFAFPEYCLGI